MMMMKMDRAKKELTEYFRKEVGVEEVDASKYKNTPEDQRKYKAARKAQYDKMMPEFNRLKRLAENEGVTIARYFERQNHPERFKKDGNYRADARRMK